MMKHKSIAEQFSELDGKRQGVLERARECARLTIPSVLPPVGYTEEMALPTPYQSVGSRGVNQLVAKLLMVIMPPNIPFFKLYVPPTLAKAAGIDTTKMNELLKAIEDAVMDYLDDLNVRHYISAVLRDAAVTGNGLLYFGKKGLKVFRLDNYVVARDASGNLIKLITREKVAWQGLPKDIQKSILNKKELRIDDPEEHFKEGVTLWTMAELKDGKWVVTQEVEDVVINQVKIPPEKFPYIVVRWSHVPGENYGRGIVEQYLGDLKSLEALSEALVSGAIQASRVIWLVSPTSVLTPKDIQDAWNGDVLVGNAADVQAVQLQKYADFQWVMNKAAEIEQRLAQVFFLVPSAIRDAERVTAEEIRLLSQELETALGGVYTLLTTELQRPLLQLTLNKLISENKIPDIEKYKDFIKIGIITGFAGLGRAEDFNRLIQFLQAAAVVPNAASYLKTDEVLQQMATSLGIDPTLIMSEQELIQKQMEQLLLAQAQQQAAAQAVGGGLSAETGEITP